MARYGIMTYIYRIKEKGGKSDEKNFVAETVAKVAKSIAVKSVNSTCTLFFYQPMETKKIKKLKKI